ncbi:F-box domain-containing protein [Artemisia annua]|uniref:F-box domain-containing protein n=1 Tax=Artemisia annua TaxID=35608 RepID=A0A2U1NP62_ARTAN|nr:F-box domain-containing protein [Artemisia annua]
MPKKLPRCENSSLEDLPDDVVLDILSRLPVKSMAYSKCVCKNWRNLVLKCWSPECLLIYCYECVDIGTHPGTLKLTEIEGKHNQNRLLRDPFMGIRIADLFPGSLVFVVGSVNGLICLWKLGDDGDEGDNTCICNPITKEYMILPKQRFSVESYMDLSCGFGVSLAGEHKVIRILCQSKTLKVEVYTLGTTNGEVWKYLTTLS